ncbi:AfsR/SARP family transcriptional regulator [Streptomyces capillispiralis]|uniref:DNA-binding SARP family transcriptional activator n=1 Tax=Streptomyces capillispiralis TaxID=68182 RepID=A0A561TCT9_9ACTN|nr:AfsR/SARP family transcriptional regulator [Streptomyces capillispiralis]TWF84922.1 DNA-binding SARP family transcriptional activator [Streptomyces capillispiralis]GHH96189.1 SARP family transcriptional regulator [Streptomyces capillispiralis]
MHVTIGVLGAVAAWDEAGEVLALRGPKHRAVLARLVVARRRVVPVARLVADLWEEPPDNAVGTVRTFVGGLRRALEPDRPPRTPPRLLVTEGPGYALRAATEDVDAWRFEQAVSAPADPSRPAARLTETLDLWRGPAFADFGDEPWLRAERARLTELRLLAVERLAEAHLASGAAARAVPDLDAHVTEHPWREEGWRLLALALYRSGRQADALAVLRRARGTLGEHLGVDPGPRLRRLEEDILRQAARLDPDPGPDATAGLVWERATAAYERAVPSRAGTRLESAAGLMRDLAVTGGGGLEAARHHRAAAVAAAEQLGDAELTARVIGVYDVPAVWTRSDDPEQARRLVAAAERTLRRLPPEGHDAARCRLLATIAVESRGTLPTDRPAAGESARPLQAARQAEEIARRLDDAPLLAFALNGTFMQTFHRTGLAARRDAIGAETVALAARHGLPRYEVLGHLVRVQSRCALGDLAGADRHATAADDLAARHELPLVGVFTTWYRALRTSRAAPPATALAAYERAAELLDGSGMAGLRDGLLPLARLSVAVRHGAPPPDGRDTGWGPYEPWVRPLLLAAGGRRAEARAALRGLPSPPRDLMSEALWCLVARAAVAVDDRAAMLRARAQLLPAAGEQAAGSGLVSLGPVAGHLEDLTAALERGGSRRTG